MRLAITLGDPRGIGPEVCAKALAALRAQAEWVLVGPTGCGVEVHHAVGDWPAGGTDAAHAGQLAGRAIEQAVAKDPRMGAFSHRHPSLYASNAA